MVGNHQTNKFGRPKGMKNSPGSRDYCESHNDCNPDDYCDEWQSCWPCAQYDMYCDAYMSECPNHCAPWSDGEMYDTCNNDCYEDGGGVGCPPGEQGNCNSFEICDCNGECAPADWLGDGTCDDGTFSHNGIDISFNCPELYFDHGDCQGGGNNCDCPIGTYWDGWECHDCHFCCTVWDDSQCDPPYDCNSQCDCHQYNEPVIGDVTNDGLVNIIDVMVVLQYILGNMHMEWWQLELADVNNDGSIDIFDIIAMIDIALSRGMMSGQQATRLKLATQKLATNGTSRKTGRKNTKAVRKRPRINKSAQNTRARIRGGGAPPETQWHGPRKRSRKRRLPTRRPRRGRDNK